MKTLLLLALAAAPAGAGSLESASAGARAWTLEFKAAWGEGISHRRGLLQRMNEALGHLVEESKPAVLMVLNGNGSGSGFVADPAGWAVTNAHVVEGLAAGAGVVVRHPDGREETAVLASVGSPEKVDLAVLRLPASAAPRPALRLGGAAAAREGHMVAALGYPLGLPFSVSQGVVSGGDFRQGLGVRFLQTDAALNPGNSGGPLLAMDGTVLGVNTRIASRSGGSEGVGFAISAEQVKAFLAAAKAGPKAAAAMTIERHLAAEPTRAAPMLVEEAGVARWIGVSWRGGSEADYSRGSAAFYDNGPEDAPAVDFVKEVSEGREAALKGRLIELRWFEGGVLRRRTKPGAPPLPPPQAVNTLYF